MPARTARYVASRVPQILVLFVIAVFAIQAAVTVASWGQQWRASRLEQTDIFEYFAVEYVRYEDAALVMKSDAHWKVGVDEVTWRDRLRCGGRTMSTQTTEAGAIPPGDRKVGEWDYSARHPEPGSDAVCQMTSVITAVVDGRAFVQRIQSQPFTPGEPRE